MPRRRYTTAVTLSAALLAPLVLAQPCPPEGTSRQQLLELRSAEFRLDPAARRESLALALLPCLESPDPVLRDSIAFEALSTWMRSRQIGITTATTLADQLQARLASDYPDPDGIARPFAALVLAELARMDRLDPFMSEARRAELLQAATAYLVGVRDYRGFDPQIGWRHGVAHGADLLLQLAANPLLDRPALDAILAAIATQVAPAGEHAYIHGESERLARPVYAIAERRQHSAPEWQQWLLQIAAPAPFSAWSEAFNSPAGLAKRHNTRNFLLSMYLSVREHAAPQTQELVYPPLRDALSRLP